MIYETEHPSVLSTGTWNGNCDPGYKTSERLHCLGYFEYDEIATGSGSQVVVRAAGDTAEELIELEIDGTVVATYALTNSMQEFFYDHTATVTPGQVRVNFINDVYAPPLDRNATIDFIRVDVV